MAPAEEQQTLSDQRHPILEAAERALRLPEGPASRWHRAGVTPGVERIFEVFSGLVILLFAAGWSWSIATTRAGVAAGGALASSARVTPVTAAVTAALTSVRAPSTAYLTQAVLELFVPMRGLSGKLRANIGAGGAELSHDSLPAGTHLQYSTPDGVNSADSPVAPSEPGVWELAVAVGSVVRPVADFSVITTRPFDNKRRGRIGLYYLGTWPAERRRLTRPGYANPSGFVEVTRTNQDTPVSEHFRLRDFLTKGQVDVWPKYLVLDMALIDKLELVLIDLRSRGHDVSGVRVMSGFRTPQYNSRGGDPSGRASLSRHMYGDAADIYFDRDSAGRWDDLDGNGRVNLKDMRVVLEAVDRVEREHPVLVGGAGIYPGTSSHGPFIHMDTRGYRARWRGSGDGG